MNVFVPIASLAASVSTSESACNRRSAQRPRRQGVSPSLPQQTPHITNPPGSSHTRRRSRLTLVSTSNRSMVESLERSLVRPGVCGRVQSLVRGVGAGLLQERREPVQVSVPGDGSGGSERRGEQGRLGQGGGGGLRRESGGLDVSPVSTATFAAFIANRNRSEVADGRGSDRMHAPAFLMGWPGRPGTRDARMSWEASRGRWR